IARIWMLRKVLADMKLIEAMETLIDRLKKTKTNAEFLMSLGRSDWSQPPEPLQRKFHRGPRVGRKRPPARFRTGDDAPCRCALRGILTKMPPTQSRRTGAEARSREFFSVTLGLCGRPFLECSRWR